MTVTCRAARIARIREQLKKFIENDEREDQMCTSYGGAEADSIKRQADYRELKECRKIMHELLKIGKLTIQDDRNGGFDLRLIVEFSNDCHVYNAETICSGLKEIKEHFYPKFDWSTVKPGMAFKVDGQCPDGIRIEELVRYVGPSVIDNADKLEQRVITQPINGPDIGSLKYTLKRALTRVPQHDLDPT